VILDENEIQGDKMVQHELQYIVLPKETSNGENIKLFELENNFI